MFLFENVRGLLPHDKGRTYATITGISEQAGYAIQKQVLNAWDYGNAQKREPFAGVDDTRLKRIYEYAKESVREH